MNRFPLFPLLSLFLLLILSSCEKPYLGEDASTGNLTVSVFQLEQTPFAGYTRATPSDACTHLNFAIYNGDNRLKQINQTSDMADFGHVSFQLDAGTYQLVVVAHSSKGNPTMTDPGTIKFDNSDGYSDTFLYSEDVTVASEPVNLSLTLHRIVALCRFVISDDYPQGVAKMQFKYTGGSGAFNAATGQGCVKSTQTVTYDITTGQKQFDLYTFPYQGEECTIHLTASALDASGVEITQRTFDIPLATNKITWFSGDFFSGSNIQSASLDLSIDTQWAAESHLAY
ncbi:MAG: hypothetical protein E7105_00425 [Prevotella sp.]|nr:hypothetical protein [Prevotella sp.]